MSFRTSVVICLFLVGLLAACGHGSKRLAGHWRGVRAEGVPPDVEAPANAFAAKMQLDVSGDVITVTTATDKQTGHYRTMSEDDKKLVIVTDKDGASDPQVFSFVDSKTVRWAVLGSKSIVFVRE